MFFFFSFSSLTAHNSTKTLVQIPKDLENPAYPKWFLTRLEQPYFPEFPKLTRAINIKLEPTKEGSWPFYKIGIFVEREMEVSAKWKNSSIFFFYRYIVEDGEVKFEY